MALREGASVWPGTLFCYLQAVCPYMMDLASLCLHKIGNSATYFTGSSWRLKSKKAFKQPNPL